MLHNTVRTFFLLLNFVFLEIQANGQQVNLDWVKTLRRTGARSEETYTIGIDAERNVYVAAGFTNTLDIDPGPAVSNVSTPQFSDIYVLKLDPHGSFVWGKQISGSRDELLSSMAVDPEGNIVLTGSFDSPDADFDPGASSFTLSAAASQDYAIFICKLDTDGNFSWAKKMEGTGYDSGTSTIFDRSGNIITTGIITGGADIDPGPSVLQVGRVPSRNPFISKLDANGNLIWGEILQTYSTGTAYYVRVDNDDNIYLSGSFQTSMDFDPGPANYILGDYLDSNNPFVAKYDRNGKFVWGKKDMGLGPFAVDRFQNIYLYGGINGYGWGKLTKLSPLGDTIWSKNVGSGVRSSAMQTTIELDSDGYVYLAGMFRYTQDFDPGPGETKYSAVGNSGYDACISKLDQDGNFIWAKHFGGYGDDFFNGIQVDNAGNVYTTGTHQNNIDMDPNAGEYIIRPVGGGNQFILKLTNCTNPTTNEISAIACYKYELNGISYTSTGDYTQHLTNSKGCDSLIKLRLQITGSETTAFITSCDSYTWEGQTYTKSGNYSRSFPKSGGCDSIRNLVLIIGQPVKTTITAEICDWNVYENYSKTGIYQDTFHSINGCDSIRTLYLTVHKPGIGTINASICAGDNYEGYTETGSYFDYYITPWGCDSTRILNLTVNSILYSSRQIDICEGESFFTGGANQTAAGTYTDIFYSHGGCDSIVTTILSVTNKPYVNLGPDRTLCRGDFLELTPGVFASYLWHDQTTGPTYRADQAGTFSVRVTDNAGCTAEDEVTINKLFDPPANFLQAIDSICDNVSLEIRGPLNFQSYHWNTGETTNKITVDHPGDYALSVTDVNGCSGSDTIRILQKNCYTALSMPTAFTPNNDQRNDQFRAKISGVVTLFRLEIFNRNGILVFMTTDPQVGWNGDYKGLALPTGVFVWQCTYQLAGKERQFEHGMVTLVRN